LSSWDDKWTEPDAIIAFDPNAKTVEKLQAGHLLDLGAIGKGYALEQAAALLEEWDVEDGLISSGGSSLWLMKGSSPEAWKVELPSIEGDKAMPFHPGTAIASSGLSFQEEHIIDPASGRSETNWKRVHVAAPRSPLADAASTAAMLLDRSALSEVVEEEPSLSFLLVSDDGPSPLAIGDYFKPLIKDHA